MSKLYKTKDELNELYKYMLRRLPNFQFIIFYGSLLGYVRENDFIENDDDIDMLLPFKDRERYIFAINQLNLTITVNELSIIQINVDNLGICDVYFYENRGPDILIRWDNTQLFSKNDIWPLKRVLFKNYYINIPKNSIKILKEIYGENWNVPTKKEDYDWNKITNVRRL